MIKLRLLQLGDIHLGLQRTPGIDHADRKFPAHLASLTTSDPLDSAMRMVVHLIENSPIDAILLVGDFCNKGDVATYGRCVDQLVELFLGKWHTGKRPAFCVPGNHDIDRSNIPYDSTAADVWAKFAPLEAAWQKHNVPILASREVIQHSLERGPARAQIIALNSCLGCGEYRGLPDELRMAAKGLIDGTADPSKKWDAIETMDSPAFALPHIETTQTMLETSDRVNVVLAHHNLLPQATPRAAPYGELFNGGQFRTMFSRASSPSLYCHGHIHDDPVEVLSVPPQRTASLVSISSPMLHQGFNIVELSYMDSGIPLGVTVQKYKIGRGHMFSSKPHEEIRIPFRSNSDYFPFLAQPRSTILESLKKPGGAGIRFPELSLMPEIAKFGMREGELAEHLIEAEWYGLVSIRDRQKPAAYWQILPDTP